MTPWGPHRSRTLQLPAYDPTGPHLPRRYDTEMAKYNAMLEQEAAEERAEREAAAAGPSDRDVEREAKRKRMEEEVRPICAALPLLHHRARSPQTARARAPMHHTHAH